MFGIVDSVEFILSEFIMSSIMLFFGDVSRDASPIIRQVCHLETNTTEKQRKEKQARKLDHQKRIAIKPESEYVRNANQPISNDHRTFRSPCKHINTTHFTIHTCLMMGEASLETSPKNNMIQDMINSDNTEK